MNDKHIVRLHYDGLAVTFNERGWFNATEVAERFGRRPNDWLATDETKVYLIALEEILNTSPAGNLICAGQSPLIVTKRGKSGGTWLHPKLAVAFARWLSPRFGVWCDIQIDQLLNGKHEFFDWLKFRHNASSTFKVMNDIVRRVRERAGKESRACHFINEAKLVNWAMTGEFGPLDRDGLSADELNLLAQLENENAVLIAVGADREQRKIELQRLAAEFRSARALPIDRQPNGGAPE